jgi:hypothetical protein
MAVGDSALFSGFSYIGVGRETTFGTYTTCPAGLPFLSASLKTMRENKILEQVSTSRTYAQRMSLSKVVEGEIDFYFQPRLSACAYLLSNAMGSTNATSATATGETAGAGAASAMDHTFHLGEFNGSYPSLCLNVRKGPTTTGKVFQYTGVRVDEFMFSAEIDEPLRITASVVCQDSTVAANDIASAVFPNTSTVLSFVDGRISVDGSFASLTSGTFWHVQSCEFGWSNSLKKDNESRRIGSDLLQVLPAGMANFTLNLSIRFDTTTAYDAMLNATQLAAELHFQGPTLPGSSIRQGLKVQFPKVFISDSGDPEIGGPDEILKSEVSFHVLRDDSSATGYAVRSILTSNIQSLT